ncbi:UNVERIFIED_CONTAM: hypothetical protein RMT77_004940 [Armadillidium vulgare]
MFMGNLHFVIFRRKISFLRTIIYSSLALLCFVIFYTWESSTLKYQDVSDNFIPNSGEIVKENSLKKLKSKSNIKIDVEKIYTNKLCNCTRVGKYSKNQISNLPQSTCSDFSTQRGKGQRVLSYSYYSIAKNLTKDSIYFKRYFEAIKYRVREAKKLYKGWTVKIYTNVTREDSYVNEILCEVYCNNDEVDLCDISDLPVFGAELKNHNGMFWRFLPLGDPTVDVFLSRDTDSVIQRREFDAVSEWLKTNKTFHVMRDHPLHSHLVLGGLWGAKNVNRKELEILRNRIFAANDSHSYNYDQLILRNIVWPVAKNDVVQHDSFMCHKHEGSWAFPTAREIDIYVGWGPYGKEKALKIFQKSICPFQCRKKPQWTRC